MQCGNELFKCRISRFNYMYVLMCNLHGSDQGAYVAIEMH